MQVVFVAGGQHYNPVPCVQDFVYIVLKAQGCNVAPLLQTQPASATQSTNVSANLCTSNQYKYSTQAALSAQMHA